MNITDLSQDQIDSLIINTLGGIATAEDEQTLQYWIAQNRANERYFMQMRDIWESTATETALFDKEEAYRRFKSRIAAYAQTTTRKRSFAFAPFFRWTAAVVIAFVLGGVTFYSLNRLSKSDKFYTVSVPLGSKSKIELPDHTTVWLNAGSTLKYDQNFAKNRRNVILEGEAYFEVAKNRKMPFTVNGKEMAVRVLGTKFNIRSYAEDPTVDVTLLEGSVNLTNHLVAGNPSCLLKPNEKATLNKQNGALRVEPVEASNWREWTRGKLVFDAEYFGQIIRRLEREYNVMINVQDKSLLKRKFYGDFRKAQSIQEIFNIMTTGNQFHYTFKESVITVYK
jgi:transmembrane sensor